MNPQIQTEEDPEFISHDIFIDQNEFPTLEKRIKYLKRKFEFEDNVPCSIIIETYPIGQEHDPNQAHLLLEFGDCNAKSCHKIFSIPTKSNLKDRFYLEGHKNLHFGYKHLEEHDDLKSARTFSDVTLQAFKGHDLSEQLEHNYRVGGNNIILLEMLFKEDDPELLDILNSRPGGGESIQRYFALNEEGGKDHDLGKFWVPQEILNKPSELTPEEWNIVRKHTWFGHYATTMPDPKNPLRRKPLPGLEMASSVTLYHHEQFKGSGYERKKGFAIPHSARITSVNDVFDALISERPYKPAYAPERALKIMFDGEKDDRGKTFQSGTFDPRVEELFSREKSRTFYNEKSSVNAKNIDERSRNGTL